MIETVSELLEDLFSKGKRKEIVRIHPMASTETAALVMKMQSINLLVVMSGEECLGIVTTSDTSSAHAAPLPSMQQVQNIMTEASKVVTVSLTDKINDIPIRFSENQIRHLIVVDEDNGNKWVAVLDQNELMPAIMANIAEEEKRNAYANGELGTT